MSVAFVGKGGTGKSTLAGSFARLVARRGRPVLALDSDPLPGMPYALGIQPEDRPIPDDAVVEGPAGGPRWVLRPGLHAETLIRHHAVTAADGVRYLQFGNLRGHISTLQRAQHAWSQAVSELDRDRWNLVGDLPGGTRQPMSGWAKYADVVCVVVEPTVKSLHTGSRLLKLSTATWGPRRLVVVANKVTGAHDTATIGARLGVVPAVEVPLDPDVETGERHGLAPLDAAPHGWLARAVGQLVDHVEALYPVREAADEGVVA